MEEHRRCDDFLQKVRPLFDNAPSSFLRHESVSSSASSASAVAASSSSFRRSVVRLSAILALFFILLAASNVRLLPRLRRHHYVRPFSFSLANSKRKQRKKVVPYGTDSSPSSMYLPCRHRRGSTHRSIRGVDCRMCNLIQMQVFSGFYSCCYWMLFMKPISKNHRTKFQPL